MMDFLSAADAWWSSPIADIFQKTVSNKDGLSQDEAGVRFARFGPNELVARKRPSLLVRFIGKLLNPLVIILLFTALISAVLRQFSDFVIVVIITLTSILLDVYQEHSADTAAEKLQKRVALTATVLRDGIYHEIPFRNIVPGDIVKLTTGDIVPADGRIFESKDLLIDQSTLTGESFPQEKRVDALVPQNAAMTDRTNSVFFGTHVVGGEGIMVALITGSGTNLGHISKELVASRPPTDFEIGISKFGYFLMRMTFLFIPVVFFLHVFLGHDILSSLLFVLALAVGFAPELLPIIITINLSKGAIRMAGKGVIVKRLSAIENFGSMDVLCTDKTGTLTEHAIVLAGAVDSAGKESTLALHFGHIASRFETGIKGAMEEAILARKDALAEHVEKVSEVPFDFYRKRLSVIVREGKKLLLVSHGAPENIFSMCHHYRDADAVRDFTDQARQKAEKEFEKLSADGYRVLGVAYKELGLEKKAYTPKDEHDAVFVGFLSFFDPPKKSAKAALENFARQGIQVKIITGDHELVTAHICRELGLSVLGVATDADIENVDEPELMRLTERTTIFARLTPETKKRVIAAIRKAGHVVGYLGDGVNDAPALRASDIGISVNNGSDIAKASADIILLHKDLHVLHDGVIEGRRTFGNVMKYIMMGLSSNFGNMVSIAIASVFLPFLPMLPVQVLLNDLLYDVSQLSIAYDRVDQSVLVKPRKWDIKFIKRFMFVFGPISSLFDILTFGFLLFLFHADARLFQTSWFLESIVTQTLVIFSIRTAVVPFFQSRANPWFMISLFGITATAIVLPFTPLAALFSFVRPPALFYGYLAVVVVAYIFLVETTKRWFYARQVN